MWCIRYITVDSWEEIMADYYLDISKGLIPGHSVVNKFGGNPDVADDTTEDIWDGGGSYPWPTTVDITHISQLVDQAALRSGTIEVQGLDVNWNLVVQTKDLNASNTTTLVALDTPLIRVFRKKVLADVVSDSEIVSTNAGDTITYSQISIGQNQTLMALYTVPANRTAFMTQYYGTVIDATNKTPTSTKFKLWAADRFNGYEFQLKHALGIPEGGNKITHEFKPYAKFNQKTDIRINALPLDEGAQIAGGFDLILVENAYLDYSTPSIHMKA